MGLGNQFATGHLLGTGAAINVELGFVPDFAIVINQTDADKVTMAALGTQFIPFTSGGTNEVVAGDTIVGATSGATAIVGQVLLQSGSWAGGDAAGVFIAHVDDITGTFGSENVYVDGDGGTNDATVTVQTDENVDIDTEVAAATGNAALSSYVGSIGTYAKGFTIGSTVSESGDVLTYVAWRK